MLHISIRGEPIFSLFGFHFTNSYITSVIVLLLLIGVAVFYAHQSRQSTKSHAYYLIHFMVKQLYTLFQGVTKEKTSVFFPLIGAIFFYILVQNWFGLLPGVGSFLVKNPEYVAEQHTDAPTDEVVSEHALAAPVPEEKVHNVPEFVPLLRAAAADLNTTLALGLIGVVMIQYYSIVYLGLGAYLSKFFNFSNPIYFFLGLLEIISELSRVLSFAFRLFGNVFAGEVLIAVIAFLVPVLATFPFLIMEIFVGFVQALVFSMLLSVLLQSSTAHHKH